MEMSTCSCHDFQPGSQRSDTQKIKISICIYQFTGKLFIYFAAAETTITMTMVICSVLAPKPLTN